MKATDTLLHIAGGVALLLWSVRMVRTGMTRAFGAALRRAIAKGTGTRVTALLTGVAVTTVLQSSTATALLLVSFVQRGAIAVTAGLAIMLGANIGTTVVAQILSFGLDWLAPLLLIAGFVSFSAVGSGRWRHIGRMMIGLGLMLVSLDLIGAGSAPLRDSPTLQLVLAPLADEPLLAVLVSAALTWLSHSSLAIVLLVMSWTLHGVIPEPLAFAFVIGANIGGALAPLAVGWSAGPVARRVPAGNLATRAVAGLLLLPLIAWIGPWIAAIDADPARQVANFHTAFNIASALVFLPLVGIVAAGCARLFPARATPDDAKRPRYLDDDALDTPSVALAAAARETLRMGDLVEDMLRRSIDVFRTDDAKLAQAIEAEDDQVDSLNEAIKLYLTSVSQAGLDEDESRRMTDILTFTTNLEHVGDIIDKNLMELARKKIRHRMLFSEAGFAEISAFHARVLDNLQLALNVFMSRDVNLARRLLNEKVAIRDAERAAAESHIGRLRAGRPESIESSSLHLDVIRDLKRINSHVTSVAYPLLEQTGALRASRLQSAD
ncbi:phosphate:Na+ symporter [Constrictibacter sp. MBR-5]|jgi:phosphate:Na+ symporter|uniref:Na/Pi cotransporter family protein n=1 Tax=Constrictibacter sp. MBR-5 TaxID=3156467 RepID=UPI003396F79B